MIEQGSLFDKYGGVETVTFIVKEFYKRMLQAPNLKRYFINVDVEKIIHHQIQLISHVMGKPVSIYSGRDMKKAHKNLKISDKSFNDTLEILEETLIDFKVEDEDIKIMLARVNNFKNEITF
jgi:hemoglobin